MSPGTPTPPPRVVVTSGKVIYLKLKYARMTVFQDVHTDKEKALDVETLLGLPKRRIIGGFPFFASIHIHTYNAAYIIQHFTSLIKT